MQQQKISKQAERQLAKIFKAYEVDRDLVDVYALWNSKLSDSENLHFIQDYVRGLSASKNVKVQIEADKKLEKKSIKQEKEEKQKQEAEQLRKEIEFTKSQFEKSLEKIKFETTEVLDKSFYVTRKLITTLINSKNINGLLLKGEAGLGKSYTCLKVFKDIGFKKGKDYDILASYCTPLELYNFLYQNKEGKILLLDDIMKIFENELSIGILLSALWGEGERIVNYHTTSPKLKIPESFIFNSKIIWCLNKLPKGLENIKSRCYLYTLEFDYKEKIMLLYEIAKIRKIPLKIVDFIYQNSDEMTPNLDFRLLLKVYDIYQENKDWKDIANALLNKNEKLALVKKLLLSGLYINDIMKEWQEKTGLSIRQFYRYKEKVKI